MQSHNPYAPPKVSMDETGNQTIENTIENLPVSEKWKARFQAIALAGGPKMPNLKNLPKSQRRHAIGFNFLAFLFGPLYYLAKGMWKRGVVLFALMVAALLVIGMVLEHFGYGKIADGLGYGANALFAIRANIDYYKKMVLEDNGWW